MQDKKEAHSLPIRGLLSQVVYKVQCAHHMVSHPNDLRGREVAMISTGQRLREPELFA